MSRRDECLIETIEDAVDWLTAYRHTITDSQVLKVIELLTEIEHTYHATVENKIDEIDSLTEINNKLASNLKRIKADLKDIASDLAEISNEQQT